LLSLLRLNQQDMRIARHRCWVLHSLCSDDLHVRYAIASGDDMLFSPDFI